MKTATKTAATTPEVAAFPDKMRRYRWVFATRSPQKDVEVFTEVDDEMHARSKAMAVAWGTNRFGGRPPADIFHGVGLGLDMLTYEDTFETIRRAAMKALTKTRANTNATQDSVSQDSPSAVEEVEEDN